MESLRTYKSTDISCEHLMRTLVVTYLGQREEALLAHQIVLSLRLIEEVVSESLDRLLRLVLQGDSINQSGVVGKRGRWRCGARRGVYEW